MTVRLHDTLSNALQPFEPLRPPDVGIYVCGPTVYDDAHIGHGRAYVVYDAIVRFLRHHGYRVRYVRNVTDIDDKILKRAEQEGVPFGEIARRYTESFHRDLTDLGLLPPDVEPRATETIPEMVALIETLVWAEKAYAAGGDVYFSIASDPAYGKLSKRDVADLEAGARVEPGEHKRDPLDFALWKAAKPGEPSWPSPWGPGRPGWHIECSAMVRKFLGETIDLHAGGRDLIFPHHENEIAQSEAATGKPFAKYWLHNGFLNIDSEKMSKSLGNFVTIRAMLGRFHPEALKLYLLSHHYRSPVDFSDAAVREAARGLDRIYRVLLSIPADPSAGPPPAVFAERFEAAMEDDFNTAKAIAALFDAVKEANRLQQKDATLGAAVALRGEVVRLGNLLGLLRDTPAEYFRRLPGEAGVDRQAIETLIAERAEARRRKEFGRADEIRDRLSRLHGVTLEDLPDGTTWRVNG